MLDSGFHGVEDGILPHQYTVSEPRRPQLEHVREDHVSIRFFRMKTGQSYDLSCPGTVPTPSVEYSCT